ncbi:MAG: DNA polymerase Y family protein [Deltaproteobacteria bacterium]|nr:DNA polymerase Y family protein [Deltaproteobacteria bacterium]
MRLACLHVPDFPLAACCRAEPELRGAPVVVADGAGPRARLVACAPAATALGIAPGLTAAQAQAIASALVVRVASADAERAAHAALADVAYSFSPRVEDGAPGTVYVDADGLTALFADERALAQAMAQRAAALGLEAQVGLAGSKIAAELAARDGGGVAVVPPHQEWQLLAPLSIDRLSPDPTLRETLQRWGVRTLGGLAALPASGLATRLGPEAAALARRARGEDATPLVPRPLPLDFEEAAQLDWGVDALEPFLFVVRGLLDRLIARLEIRGLVCGDLRLSLGLADRGRDERTVTVAAPSNAIKPLLTLVRVHLETHPPRAAVESVRLAAIPERLRAAQLDLFRPAGPAPAQLAATLARLNALCGDAARVGAPGLADSHRPEAHRVDRFAVERAPRADERSTPSDEPRKALRAIRPPLALEVFCRRDQPDFIRPAGVAPALACTGRVVSLAGPWRLHGEWWTAATLHRDYYDAQLSDGGVYRVYFDRQQQRWFLDGSYD